MPGQCVAADTSTSRFNNCDVPKCIEKNGNTMFYDLPKGSDRCYADGAIWVNGSQPHPLSCPDLECPHYPDKQSCERRSSCTWFEGITLGNYA